ncbi:hypothetical protein ACJJVG_08765 [Pseudocitrobacter faecalis]|uniref:hypothetical protein n=1 Tax=Pseudocitrobacter faecalis TaxID=1398493 RepID=UPI00389A6149
MTDTAKRTGVKTGVYIVALALVVSILVLVHAIRENTEAQKAVFQSNTVIIEGMQHYLSTHEAMK